MLCRFPLLRRARSSASSSSPRLVVIVSLLYFRLPDLRYRVGICFLVFNKQRE